MKSIIMKSKRKYNGYTIVELLVAAIILTVAIASIVAVVSKGRTLDISDKHRRQARSVIDEIIEKQFNDRGYDTITVGLRDTYTETLDDRDGNPLDADVSIDVISDNETVTVSSIDTDIPVKRVTIIVSWTEPAGNTESITISKWIAKAR